VQNIEAQYLSNEGILDEGLEIVIYVGDDIDARSENASSTDTGDEADDSGKHLVCLRCPALLLKAWTVIKIHG
jgi:hypothetical protein